MIFIDKKTEKYELYTFVGIQVGRKIMFQIRSRIFIAFDENTYFFKP